MLRHVPLAYSNGAAYGLTYAVAATRVGAIWPDRACHTQANILQPLTHVGTLNLRYEAVEELLASEEMHVGHCASPAGPATRPGQSLPRPGE